MFALQSYRENPQNQNQKYNQPESTSPLLFVLGTSKTNTKVVFHKYKCCVPKNTNYVSRKILEYGLDIDYKDISFLKTELITSKFRITDNIQLELHLALASYLSKNPVIFKYAYNPDKFDKFLPQ